MGQKVHPKVFRLGVVYGWSSRWFGGSHFREHLRQDVEVKKYLRKLLKDAAVEKVEIERSANKVTIYIYTAKPGFVIGRGGQGIEDIRKKVVEACFGGKGSLNLTIQEVKNPGLSAELVKQTIVSDIEKRIPYRRTMRQALSRAERAGAQGVKIIVSGRLNGAEIARSETLASGKVPLHTLRADIDYARGVANTTYGTVGVKVWIYRGNIAGSEERS
jgi:small subunit ribosomal protein S3